MMLMIVAQYHFRESWDGTTRATVEILGGVFFVIWAIAMWKVGHAKALFDDQKPQSVEQLEKQT